MRAEAHRAPRAVNHQPLTPADFLVRAVELFPDRTAVVDGERTLTYRQFGAMAARFADWLNEAGVGVGDVVSVISLNRPEMLAAHYAVPGIGAVLNAVNTRLDVDTVAYILGHSESRLLITDEACAAVAREAAGRAGVRVVVIGLELALSDPGEAVFAVRGVEDEWQPLCINYTSGTTGRPKGVVYHHRGAYLNAIGNVLALGFGSATTYLWTLPMFHCNGWCQSWAVTAAGGTHVCLDRVDPEQILLLLQKHAVTHFSCAPVVLYMLLNHPARQTTSLTNRVLVATGGAAPTASLIEQLDAMGIDIVHLYGLTESFGPATMRELPASMNSASPAEKAAFLARQGHRHPTAGHVRVVDTQNADVPADGATMGEILLRGNTLMQGYYGDAEATEAAFAGDWFHTGDLAVRHGDGSIEIRDRSKDVIISGGENISSLEIESVLHQHPSVLLAAVVAEEHPKWGETPCAVIELKPGAEPDEAGLIAFCRERLAGFKVPRRFVFRELPKTSTGKIQKFVLRQELRS